MCAACVAQGVVYVGGAITGLQVMRARAKATRTRAEAPEPEPDAESVAEPASVPSTTSG
jgi:hypothetical protein